MRKTFINTLIELAHEDKDIVLITADMGFWNLFLKNFLNVQ